MNDKELILLILGVVLLLVGIIILIFVSISMANTKDTLVDGVPSKYTTTQYVFLGISIVMLVLSFILLIIFFISLYRDTLKKKAIDIKKSASDYIDKKKLQSVTKEVTEISPPEKMRQALRRGELPSQQKRLTIE